MDLPPSYATLPTLPALGASGSWRVGRGRYFAWVVPSGPQPQPTGWRLRVSVEPGSVASAWDALRPVLARRRLGGRAALPEAAAARAEPLGPSTGAMLTVFADGVMDRAEAQALAETIERALAEAGCAPGLPVLSDRPLPGSAYLSVRCDPPEMDGGDARLDYNALSRPGPFWGVRLGPGLPVWADVGRLLEGIAGPDVLWEGRPEGWRAEGPVRTLRALRRGLAGGGIQAVLGLAAGRPTVWVPADAANAVRAAWHACREGTDAWRVALLLHMPDGEVLPRDGDALPPRVSLPRLDPSGEAALMARLSIGGLVAWRLRAGPLEVLVPGRAAADAFEAAVADEGDAMAVEEVLPIEEMEPLPAAAGPAPTSTPVRVRERPRRQIRLAPTSRAQAQARLMEAAAVAERRRREAGIVSVARRVGLDRLLVPREREAGLLQTAEDPRALLAEVGLALDAASRLGEESVSRVRIQEARGAALAIGAMTRRPDLSMARAFAGVRRVEGTVSGMARELAESPDPRAREEAARLESLAWRVRARINAGPPRVHLALTREEEARLARTAGR
jgi:hypothetical protein